jgi:DNA-binding response OmpR family regulator
MARILIVEDDAPLADVLTEYFLDLNFTVDRAGDGWLALQRVRDFSPDVIVLDLMLPRLNGAETAWRLRRQSETRRIPIVAITAVADVGDFEGILAVDSIVPKPFDLDDLGQQVTRLLHEPPPEDAHHNAESTAEI